MTAPPSIQWPGQSGKSYTYQIYPIDQAFNDVGGNYIFAKVSGGYWTPLYIGETNSLKNRLDNHEKRPCALRNGATHIHAHANSGGQARLDEETDLVRKWKPTCNE